MNTNEVLTEKLEAIDSYLERGWHLIPLHGVTEDGICRCYEAEKCKSPGKHSVGKWKTCSNHIQNKDHAHRVWTLNPDYNVGIATGTCSGIWVIDVDVDNGKQGMESLEKLMVNGGQLLYQTLVHTTGSGGFHFILEMPADGSEITNATSGFEEIYPGIDLRGTGGLIVAPPSESNKGPYDVYLSNDVDTPRASLLEQIRVGRKSRLTEVETAPEQAYDELPAQVQQMCNAYARKALQSELQRFTDEYGCDNWDKRANEIAFNCFLISNAPWNDLENGYISKTYSDYEIHNSGVVNALFEAGFRGGDSNWNDERLAKCILSAYESVVKVGKDPKPMPQKAQELLNQLNNAAPQQSTLTNGKVSWGKAYNFDPSTIKWLPGGFAREGDYMTIIGDGKVGKSVFCHDWAWKMATGQEFLGETMDNATPVLYLDRENPEQIFIDHFRSYGATEDTMGLLDFRSFPEFRGLDTPEGGTYFVQMVKDTGAKVVFIDTISRFVEGPENDNDTWLAVYRNTIVPLRAYDQTITVVRIDHFGKDKAKGGRGGSSKTQDVDSVYEMKKTQGGGFVLERTHTRSGLGPETLEFNRTGRALNDRWAEGETSHVLKPKWTVGKNTAVDKTEPAAMAAFLDEQCIPDGEKGWGVRKTREFLQQHGYKGATAKMDEVQSRRKERPEYDMVCPVDCEHR